MYECFICMCMYMPEKASDSNIDGCELHVVAESWTQDL